MDNKIGEHSEEYLLSVAKEVVQKNTGNSRVFDTKAEEGIPKFAAPELQLGRVLGRGGFCVVSEVTKIHLDKGDVEQFDVGKSEDENFIYSVVQDRGFMARHCIRKGKDCRYAVKRVQDSVKKDPQTYISAVVDLAVETRFLSVIRHPNIIKMRAMFNEDPFSPGFFIVLDRLYDIMPFRLKKWKKQKGGAMKKIFQGKKSHAFWSERMTVAYDIAHALSYMHGLNIIYRDLKPDNIGFDVRGDVKIFDLGLAKELDPSKKLEDGTYNLTCDTGSLRYMAPEVALGQTYNETCDVFSFAVLLWQILTTHTPYEGFNVKMFEKMVIKQGVRPKVDDQWSDTIKDLFARAFVPHPKRPLMVEVCDILREELMGVTDEVIPDKFDVSFKSRGSNLSRGSNESGVLPPVLRA